MFDKRDVLQVRKAIEKVIGSKVSLESGKGRQRSEVSEGIVLHAYPSIFIIQLLEGKIPSRKVSFSYTDVLTNNVEITLCE